MQLPRRSVYVLMGQARYAPGWQHGARGMLSRRTAVLRWLGAPMQPALPGPRLTKRSPCPCSRRHQAAGQLRRAAQRACLEPAGPAPLADDAQQSAVCPGWAACVCALWPDAARRWLARPQRCLVREAALMRLLALLPLNPCRWRCGLRRRPARLAPGARHCWCGARASQWLACPPCLLSCGACCRQPLLDTLLAALLARRRGHASRRALGMTKRPAGG